MAESEDPDIVGAIKRMTPVDVYLNHAGTSWPKPDVVSHAVQEAMGVSPSKWPRRFEEAHLAIADFFGIEDVNQLLITPGCTSALSIAIGDALIQPGKLILTSRWEHHALHRPLMKLASTANSIDYIPLQNASGEDCARGPIDLNWLEQALSTRDVGLVAITAACNVTGELLPYKEITELSHRYGAMVLIDAAQIAGWGRLNLPKMGADIIAFGGHKGLQSPWGIGALYLSGRAQMECVSAVCELPGTSVGDLKQKPRPGYCDVGSVDQLALAGLHAAVTWLGQRDLQETLSAARRQMMQLRDALAPFDTIQFFSPSDPNKNLPTLAFGVAGRKSGEVAAVLREHSIIAGSGLQCAPQAHQTLGTQETGLVRLSIGVGQADEEIKEVIDRMQTIFQDDLPAR